MAKILRPILQIAAVAVNFLPVIGSLASFAISLGLSALNSALAARSSKVPQSNRDRLYATIDPSAPRKIVYGSTAMATDIRYQEWGGTNQEYRDDILCLASHKVAAVRELWIEDKQAWTSTGGVTSAFAGYLTVTVVLEGNASNTIAINGGSKWGASRRLTGCAYMRLRFKTTGNSKKAESPFASSISQRLTIIGDGMPLYDPRLDSTAGGTGSQRADDQTTWTWSATSGNNPALQILAELIGWRIQNPTSGTWKLAVGAGIPPRRIDMASFIAAANLCEESVTLAAGGTEPRYRSAIVLSEADTFEQRLEALLAACAGTLRDASGKLSLHILYNDLAVPVAAFTDDHVLASAGFEWSSDQEVTDSFNIVRGRYSDPSTNSLYQMVDYPAVTTTSFDGIDRTHPFDLAAVQSASQAQRLAKQELQRAQFPGTFSSEFTYAALRCIVGEVVTLTFSALGFSAKLFRVTEQTIRMNGTVAMTLREENAAIYAWSASEAPAITASAPTLFDPLNAPLIQAVSETYGAIIAGDSNRVRFSQFERGTYGWDEVADAANIVGPISTGATSGKAWVKLAGTATASGQIFSIGNALSGASQTWASGTAGEKTSAQAGIEVTGAVSSTSLVQRFYNSSGAQVGSDAVLQTVSGAQSFNTKLKGFATWPSGAVKSALFVQCTTSGAGAVSASLIEPMITGATTSQIEHPAFTPGPNSDDAADVTAQAQVEIVRPSDQIIYRDWQGTVKTGQFPRTLTVLVTRGGTDIRTADDVTYAITATGVTATINTTTGSTDKGRITVTDGGAGSIVVTVTVGGIARTPQTITFRTEDDTPPINNGSSGGTDSSLASVSSTSFTAMSSTDSGEALLTVTLTSGQTLNANATVDYSWSVGSGSGSNALKAKAQYRLVGDTTWLDFAGTVTGSNATWIAVDFSGDPGALTLAQSKTGLAAGNYETRLVGAKNTSSGNAITINSGSFTASRS